MLRPLLFIGVGGSGGKTIRSIKQALNRKLESVRYEGGIPGAWQFLQIDTTYDGVSFPAPMLPQDEFHCVVPRGAGFNDILTSITKRGTLTDQQNMLAGWGTPAPPVNLNIDMSRTMQRAIGRQVAIADSAETLNAIRSAISKMQAPTAFAELASVAKALGGESPKNSPPQAFIVSSLGGGSGSGMFMDIAELLKRAAPQNWAQEAVAFLYTADVFRSIGPSVSEVAKNSLGVMNELIASQWVGLSERSELLYSKYGLVPGNPLGNQSYGCKLNLFFGAKSSRAILCGGMDDILLNVGEALAGAISDGDIFEFMLEIAIISQFGNSNRPQLDSSGLAPESVGFQNSTLTTAGIGFGQLTLGTDRVVDYVADAMSRAQIETLLWPDFDSKLLEKGASATVSELIQEKSDQMWPNFLVGSGLDVRGSQNQVIDALLPDQLQERIKQFIRNLVMGIFQGKPIPIAKLSRAVWSEWEIESETFLKELKYEVSAKAERWVPEIQDKIRNLVALELTSNGYALVTNLTDRLERELRENVIPELLRDHKEFANAVSGFDGRVFNARVAEIADGLDDVSTQNVAFLEKLSSSLSRALEFQVSSYLNNLAASLVQDALTSFIEPLKNQLAFSGIDLQIQVRGKTSTHGPRNSLLGFPLWGSGIVPDRYKPRAIERILIDFSEYESTYEFYAGRDSSEAEPFELSARSALLGKRLNPVTDDKNEQSLVTLDNQWITTVRDAQGVIGSIPGKSEWKFRTELEQLSENNRRWLRVRDSSFGKFTDMSIRDFVLAFGERPVIRAAREAEFENAFGEMISMSYPFAELNLQAVCKFVAAPVGGSAYGIKLKSSKIPFAMSSNVGQVCVNVLQQHGFDPNGPYFESTWFDAGSNASTMSAVATHVSSLPAWAFASLTEPILEAVARSKNQVQTWNQFWHGRRSRPLVEAIPFEAEMRRSIITGWFIARLFGLIEIDFDKKITTELVDKPMSPEVASFLRSQGLDVEASVGQKEEVIQRPSSSSMAGRSVRAWNPTLEVPGWSTFPNPLLPTHREDERRRWVLPQLLVSAGIALAEFGKSGDPEFINGYRLLKYLGREVTTAFEGRDNWDGNGIGDMLPTGIRSRSTFIKDWVTAGTKPEESLDLLKFLETNIDMMPDRREALSATVETLRGQYTEIWADLSSTPWHMLPETWELKEDIDLALSDIIEYLEGQKKYICVDPIGSD